MSKHFLYLTDYYYPSPTSIGVCSDMIIRQLIKDGHEVDVVCFGDTANGEGIKIARNLRVFHVKDRLWERLQRSQASYKVKIGRLICRISQFSVMYFFPMSSVSVPIRYYHLVKKIYNRNSYDEIISSYAPFEACYAACCLKKKNPDIRWSIYILDTFTNRGASKFFSEKWNDRHGWRWEKKFFPKTDKIINLRCHEKHHQQSRYNDFRYKMYFVDIPLFDPGKFQNIETEEHDEELRFVYTGRIDSHWYSPRKMCELFWKLSEGKNWRLHFFGNPGDCRDYLAEMNRLTNGKIVMDGFVSRDRVKQEIKNADVLVSFCHMDSDMVQSKIFDYMSTGSKILHLTDLKYRDSAREYYKKYRNAVILDETEWNDRRRMNQIVKFLEDKEKIPISELQILFEDNRPQTTAWILEK